MPPASMDSGSGFIDRPPAGKSPRCISTALARMSHARGHQLLRLRQHDAGRLPVSSTKSGSGSGCCSRPWCSTSVRRERACPSGRCSSTRRPTAPRTVSSRPASPMASGDFGQAGLRLGLSSRLARSRPEPAPRRTRPSSTAASSRRIWDVRARSESVAAAATAFLTFPFPLHPILALRGGARKVFGDYPFNEAAFVGGMSSVRTLVPQRYAGDASLAGTAELRLPAGQLPAGLPARRGSLWVRGRRPGLRRRGLARRMAYGRRRRVLGRHPGSIDRHQCRLDEWTPGRPAVLDPGRPCVLASAPPIGRCFLPRDRVLTACAFLVTCSRSPCSLVAARLQAARSR